MIDFRLIKFYGNSGAGGGATLQTPVTLIYREDIYINLVLDMLPLLYINTTTGNSGGNAGVQGNTGGLGGNGGIVGNTINATFTEKSLIVSYLRTFYPGFSTTLGQGRNGGTGGPGGAGTNVRTSGGGNGQPGATGYNGYSGALLVEWGL